MLIWRCQKQLAMAVPARVLSFAVWGGRQGGEPLLRRHEGGGLDPAGQARNTGATTLLLLVFNALSDPGWLGA